MVNNRLKNYKIEQRHFPEIINQKDMPMCASIAVSSMISYYVRERTQSLAYIDPFGLHDYIEGEFPGMSAKRLETALAAWEKGNIPINLWKCNNVLQGTDNIISRAENEIRPRKIISIGVEDNLSADSIINELIHDRPVLLDIPLMLSSFLSYETGVLPVPDSIAGDRLISRHVVLVVGYDQEKRSPSQFFDDKGAWLIRNCWGREWGCEGLGWIPFDVLQCARQIRATFVSV